MRFDPVEFTATIPANPREWQSYFPEAGTVNSFLTGAELGRGKLEVLNALGSSSMGIWTETAGENAMRLERVSRGWIGNTTWKEPAPLIQFISPADLGDLQDRAVNRLVTGQAFFLKNVTYKPAGGKSLAMAPLFVVSNLERFVPVVDRTPEYILFGVLVGTILMVVLIFFLVRADSRSSKKLQEELVRRRRERRARSDQTEATPQSS